MAARSDVLDAPTDKLDRFAELWWGEDQAGEGDSGPTLSPAVQPQLVIRAERV